MVRPTHHISRRKLLLAGGIGTIGSTGRGLLGLPELLAAENRVSTSQAAVTAKSCIFIYQYGGLSQLDSWDPKSQAAAEIRGPYKPIATRTPGFQVGELMPRLAEISDKYCVIRSMSHSVPVHNLANEMLLAGRSDPRKDSPSFGAIVTRLRPTEASMPSHVWLQKFGGGAAPAEPAYLTGGHLGMGHAPLLLGERHDDNPGIPGFQVRAFESAQDVSLARHEARWRLLQQMNAASAIDTVTAGLRPAATLQSLQERAFTLLHGPDARRAFDVEQESPTMRDR